MGTLAATVTQDNWPNAVELIVLVVAGTLIALGWLGAFPWQNRRNRGE